jgi:hypothetical protein
LEFNSFEGSYKVLSLPEVDSVVFDDVWAAAAACLGVRVLLVG